MKYEVTEAGPIREELWNEKTVRVHFGGFNLDVDDFPAGIGYAKKGLPLAVDFATRNATPVKTAKVTAVVADDATAIPVAKGHIFKVGDFIGTADGAQVITGITAGADSDTITVGTTLGEALAVGDVLTSATGAGEGKLHEATKLNYADVKLEGQPSCSAIYAVDEVREGKLPYPLTDAIKESLTNRFLIIP